MEAACQGGLKAAVVLHGPYVSRQRGPETGKRDKAIPVPGRGSDTGVDTGTRNEAYHGGSLGITNEERGLKK